MSETFSYQNLVAGDFPRVTEAVVVASGQGALAAGTVVGLAPLSIAAVATEANTGKGLMGSVALGSKAKVGAYLVKCITAASGGGIFSVIDPEGVRLADATVGTAYAGPIGFTIADGTPDFAVGDLFTVTVSAAASPKVKKVDSTAVDGSQHPHAVLSFAVDATSADAVGTVWLTGEFAGAALVFGGTDTTATHKAALRDLGIYIKSAVAV